MSNRFRALLMGCFRCLPGGLREWIRQLYYARVLKTFDPDRWPPAEGVRKLLPAGARVVDIGANVGYVSRLLSLRVGPTGAVYSLEPVPDTFKVLASNVRRLGLANVHPICAAASSTDGEGCMQVPDYPQGGVNYYESRLVPDGEATASSLVVKVRRGRLDALLPPEAAPVAFIKIDAEGHELEDAQGSLALLRRDHPALLIEVEGDPDEPESKAAQLFLLLKTEGYEPYLFSDGSFVRREPGGRSVDYFFFTPAQADRLCRPPRAHPNTATDSI